MRGVPVLLVLLLTGLPAVASAPAPEHVRKVEGLVALPTPLGPVTALDDSHVWHVTVPQDSVVVVSAEGSPTSWFHLRAHPVGSPDPSPLVPSRIDSDTLGAAGTWRVSVDPAAGAQLDVTVRFRGFAADGRTPVPIEVVDVKGPNRCVVFGVCLP